MLEWSITKYVQFREFQRGQTMTEYVLVLTAIAIAALVAFKSLGSTISADVTSVAADF
jgi:Flp pilus assembly pilin Flp